MKLKALLTAIAVILFTVICESQVINAYAKVTNVSGTTITLSNVNETSDTFEDGEQVIIIQVQDDVIGTHTNNDANFGLLGSIQSAGLYEIRVISSHTESGGSPNTITLDNLTNVYNTGANSSVQVISFPQLGSPDYTTSGNISALAWNGNIGGIVAFQVAGTLTLANNINADEAGFRGANSNGGGSTGCTGGSSFRVATQNNHADKGEGIYRNTTSNYAAGRAHILNGGGGGNSHNGGGGGGGNFSAGGLGGPGWPNCSPSAGGMGGIDLSAQISGNRIFMGGGGGSGEGNNGGAQTGGNGGGIVLIKATSIETTGACAGISISANGQTITSGSGNDGNSGGGAAGTIVIDCANWNIDASCDLTISSNGGNGGEVNHGSIHGAGGGGGQGAVIYTNNQPTVNTTVETIPGTGGQNCTTCGNADDGAGTSGDGIITNVITPLPVELIEFLAIQENDIVDLHWLTAAEINNRGFEIERTKDGFIWETIGFVEGMGNTSAYTDYIFTDDAPFPGVSYYRLKQIDFDGAYEFSSTESVVFERENEIKLYPNPGDHQIQINIVPNENIVLKVFNYMGQSIPFVFQMNSSSIQLNTMNMQNGMYLLQIVNGNINTTLSFEVLHK